MNLNHISDRLRTSSILKHILKTLPQFQREVLNKLALEAQPDEDNHREINDETLGANELGSLF